MTQLTSNRFRSNEHENNYWTVYPEHGTPFEALLDPGYWAHVSAKMKPYDELRVIAEDGSYYGKLLVQDAGKLYAKVAKLEYYDLNVVEVKQAGVALEGHEVKWRGPVDKWCVVRGKDVLVKGKTKDEANSWLAQYGRTIAA